MQNYDRIFLTYHITFFKKLCEREEHLRILSLFGFFFSIILIASLIIGGYFAINWIFELIVLTLSITYSTAKILEHIYDRRS